MATRTLPISMVHRRYSKRIVRLLNRIRKACEAAGFAMDDEPWEMSGGEEYAWYLTGEAPGYTKDKEDEYKFDIHITINESRFSDGEDVFGINFSLDMTAWGGQIIAGVAPGNYSDDIWVSRKDPDAVLKRWTLFEGLCDTEEIVKVLQHYVEVLRHYYSEETQS